MGWGDEMKAAAAAVESRRAIVCLLRCLLVVRCVVCLCAVEVCDAAMLLGTLLLFVVLSWCMLLLSAFTAILVTTAQRQNACAISLCLH